MKKLIRKLLRVGLNESINLNLTKQLRGKQRGMVHNKMLDNIFGKNIYRLYYDLSTGKQITPTRKEPKLRFDVKVQDRLKNTVTKVLSKHGFEVIDFDKNITINKKNKQEVKISKILNRLDGKLLNNYTTYLDSINNQNTETKDKLYVVVSRHSHDIASMSAKPNITSCESLADYTDISQTQIPSAMAGIDDPREGGGQYIWGEIQSSSIITYLIKEGDWNIEDPMGRILGTNLCKHYSNANYAFGGYAQKFKEFWIEWVGYYRTKVLKEYELEFDDDLFDKDSKELLALIKKYIGNNNRQVIYILRGLIINNRYDVYGLIFNDGSDFNWDVSSENLFVDLVVGLMDSVFKPQLIKSLPPQILGNVKKYVDEKLDNDIRHIKRTYEFVTDEKFRNKLLSFYIDNGVNKLPNVKDSILLILGLESNFDEFKYTNMGKAVSNDKLNTYNKMVKTINNSDVMGMIYKGMGFD